MGCKNRVLSIRALWDPFTLTPCQSAMPADSIRLQVPGQAAGTPPGTVLQSTQLPVALPNVPPTGSALPRPVSFRFFSVNRSETSSKRSRAFDDRKTRQSKAAMHRRKSHRALRQADVVLLLSAVWQWDAEPLEMPVSLSQIGTHGPRDSKDTRYEKRDALTAPKQWY